MNINYKFDPKATYLIAVSFGSSSMALLDMMQKQGVKPVVAAVDYHKFDSSSSDMEKLGEYCRSKGLVYRLLDTYSLPKDEQWSDKEAFQDWARKVRYGWYAKLYAEYRASALFVAHHQEDLIETYLLQKAREGKQIHYGFGEVSTVQGMVVVRPLLNFSHEDLLEYDAENHVPYNQGTELELDKTVRSEIRSKVANLNEIEREQILAEMRAANDEALGLTRSVKYFKNDSEDTEELEIRALIALPRDAFASTLVAFVNRGDEPIELTAEDIASIREFCLGGKPNDVFPLKDGYALVRDYDTLTFEKDVNVIRYTYALSGPEKLETKEFSLDFTMGAEDRGIHAEDYPLTIRTAIQGDQVKVHGYMEPVRKLYSQWKMPIDLREIWPIFLNKDGKIIYVPRYRKVFREYHTSKLVMKI